MKAKRTYNLSRDVIELVRRLVETDHVAPTQDALVERAILHYDRHLLDIAEERAWSAAASDEDFRTEQARIWREFESDDNAAFER